MYEYCDFCGYRKVRIMNRLEDGIKDSSRLFISLDECCNKVFGIVMVK
jgi:hypothetical protein